MIRQKVLNVLMLCAAIAACSHGDSEFQHLSVLDDSHVAVHAPGRADAIVSASGALSIAGTPVTVNAAQAQIAARYFTSAVALRDDAMKTGAAGASIVTPACVAISRRRLATVFASNGWPRRKSACVRCAAVSATTIHGGTDHSASRPTTSTRKAPTPASPRRAGWRVCWLA